MTVLLNPDYAEDTRRFCLEMPIARFLGIELESVGPGMVVAVQPHRPELCYRGELFQAGPVSTLGDCAAGFACLTVLPKHWSVSTIDFVVKLLAPARGERLVARGRVLQSGRTLSVGAADVFGIFDGQEEHCATLLATMRNIAPPSRPVQP